MVFVFENSWIHLPSVQPAPENTGVQTVNRTNPNKVRTGSENERLIHFSTTVYVHKGSVAKPAELTQANPPTVHSVNTAGLGPVPNSALMAQGYTESHIE